MASSDMETRFHSFALMGEGAEAIDDLRLDTRGGQRADYLWRSRSVIVELKVLQGDPQHKINSTFETLRLRNDFPVILGQAPAHKVLAHLPDGDEQLRRLRQKIMRSVEAAFRDAKGQIANTKRLLGLDDALGILVLLNPDVESLDPIDVGKEISRLMQERQSDTWSVDAVWLLSEAHLVGGAQPCIIIGSDKADRFSWAREFLSSLNAQWGIFNNSPVLTSDAKLLTDLPMKRKSEQRTGPLTNEQRWRSSYRANPYLSQLDDDALREFGEKAIADLMPYFLVGGPRKPMAEIEQFFVRWTHFLEEASDRGFDARGMGFPRERH
ncbi:hypothetical protein [Stenotrophomonas sp. SAU14A_NAIMI4_8]|uniref:hypothetical protein n=1 Tax=Stenotrophomonas sp. SAU14A_NAIMI4_8 TaxID=2072409 RepID=UPI000D540233|nr:hypothetical protein [Stenotrophomonas sp. SAU14A_NAIMI4_8]AWH32954.1 hypothetical protein C1930_08825 [Stenotrophomonas sp. SAU14A_NAIMI4_8]